MTERQQKVPHDLIEKTLRDNPTLSAVQIARHLGISIETVGRINRERNVRPRRPKRESGVTSKGLVGRLMRELADKYDVDELVRKTGLSQPTIVRLRGRPINPTLFVVEVLAGAAGYTLELVPKKGRPACRK